MKTRDQIKLQLLQDDVDDWNESNPVGTPVVHTRDSGATIITRTSSVAQILSGHTAVIWLEGVAGCVKLDRVAPQMAQAGVGGDQ